MGFKHTPREDLEEAEKLLHSQPMTYEYRHAYAVQATGLIALAEAKVKMGYTAADFDG